MAIVVDQQLVRKRTQLFKPDSIQLIVVRLPLMVQPICTRIILSWLRRNSRLFKSKLDEISKVDIPQLEAVLKETGAPMIESAVMPDKN